MSLQPQSPSSPGLQRSPSSISKGTVTTYHSFIDVDLHEPTPSPVSASQDVQPPWPQPQIVAPAKSTVTRDIKGHPGRISEEAVTPVTRRDSGYESTTGAGHGNGNGNGTSSRPTTSRQSSISRRRTSTTASTINSTAGDATRNSKATSSGPRSRVIRPSMHRHTRSTPNAHITRRNSGEEASYYQHHRSFHLPHYHHQNGSRGGSSSSPSSPPNGRHSFYQFPALEFIPGSQGSSYNGNNNIGATASGHPQGTFFLSSDDDMTNPRADTAAESSTSSRAFQYNQEENRHYSQHPPTPSPTPPPQTTHYWTSDHTRRLEYAAIDAATSGVKGWVLRHLVPDCFVPGKSRYHVGLDDDRGSVRRYRLDLAEEDEEEWEKGMGKKKRKGAWGWGWSLFGRRRRRQ